jgi:hypothetical protein
MGVGLGAGGNGVIGDVNGDVRGVVVVVAAAGAAVVLKFLNLSCSSIFTLLLLLIEFCC